VPRCPHASHAAFELLDAYRFDMLLLAESVVARIEGGDRPATLLHAAIATGRSLGLEVLAPGVRSARQLALLRELGCDFACGPVVAAPMSYERLLPWLGARLGEHAAGAAAG
jgi:EAL domain-containing protein (putative c-di-GMP-specific phosphodiesterase class I)